MISTIDIVYFLLVSVSYALYLIAMKNMPSAIRLITFFWIYVIAYIVQVTLFLGYQFFYKSNVYAVESLIRQFTFYNAPLYLLAGVSFTWSLVIFQRLLERYDITLISPFSQITLIFTQLGYVLLGDATNWIEFSGVMLVSFGALITGLPFLWRPLQAIKSIPRFLWHGVLAIAALEAVMNVIVFLITEKTTVNKLILDRLQFVFSFAQHSTSFQTNLGEYLFIVIVLYFYLTHHGQGSRKIISTFYQYWKPICVASILYVITIYAMDVADLLIPDQTVVTGLSTVNAPILIFFGHSILKEHITLPKIIGSAVMIVGALFIAYSS